MMEFKYKTGGKFNTYIPLHGHTSYSLGDGTTRIHDLISKVKEIGANAAGLTEHGNMMSFFKFYKEAKENGVTPILGCELYVNDLYYEDNARFLELKKKSRDETDSSEDEYGSEDSSNDHFLVYAKNIEGLNNLLHLSNEGFFNFYRKPLLNYKRILESLDHNNIVTTGCIQSKFNKLILTNQTDEAKKMLKSLKDKLGDDFYLEIQLNKLEQQDKVNQFYEKMSEELSIKPVFALDYHYTNKDDWYIQYLLYVIKQRQTVSQMPEDKWFYVVRDLYIKNIDEVYKIAESKNMNMDFFESAIDSTFEIRDKVNIEIQTYKNNFPKFVESEEESRTLFLEKLERKFKEKVLNGVIPRDKIKEYSERIEFEVGVIIKMGYTNYFLILDDLLNNFVYKNGGATGMGRGSAVSSLVLFVLDITKIDPVRHNLIFERFLNLARKDPADCDVDLDSESQKIIEQYLKEKYGEDKVCHIINFGKFGAKTTVKDLCRVFELDYNLSNKLTSYFDTIKSDLPIDEQLDKAKEIAEKQKDQELLLFIDKNKKLFVNVGSRFVGMIRQTGKHASGTLLSNKPLIQSDLPIYRVDGEIVSGAQEGGDEREISELGYCKLDLLGLITASIIRDVIRAVERKYNIKNLENKLLTSNFDDEEVFKQFAEGNCRDIFQFGSDSMISILKDVKPKTIYDLSDICSLFRPAAIAAGSLEQYIEARKDIRKAERRISSIHPDLWKILKSTYGEILYQEQIMFLLQDIGGFTLEQSDSARKIIKLLHKGNQDKTENFNKMLQQLKTGAEKKGIKKKDIDWLLDLMAKYSEVSFNLSHSLSYAVNAYICMWLKVHYPKEYFVSLLDYSSVDDMSWFIKEAKNSSIKFAELKLGEVSEQFSVDYEHDRIRYGLNIIKGLSSKDVEAILNMKASSGNEVVKYIIDNKITKRTYEPLCRLSFFDNVVPNGALLEHVISSCKRKFDEEKISELFKADINQYSKVSRFNFEKQYLQFYLSDHPFNILYEFLSKEQPDMLKVMKSPKQFDSTVDDGEYIIFGIVNDIQIKKSKKSGKEYYKMIVEDDVKQLYVTVFNARDVRDIKIGNSVIIEVMKNKYGLAKTWKGKILKLG